MTSKQYIENMQKIARNEHFVDHAATLTKYTENVYAIDWRNKNGSSFYSVRYFFDQDALYITGDLGEGIFQRYGEEPAKQWLGNLKSLDYLLEKLRCLRGETYDIDDEVWEHDLDKWRCRSKLRDSETPAIKISEIRDYYGKYNFQKHVFYDDELQKELSFYELEEISNFGKVINSKIILWIEGLKIAYEQLGWIDTDKKILAKGATL